MKTTQELIEFNKLYYSENLTSFNRDRMFSKKLEEFKEKCVCNIEFIVHDVVPPFLNIIVVQSDIINNEIRLNIETEDVEWASSLNVGDAISVECKLKHMESNYMTFTRIEV